MNDALLEELLHEEESSTLDFKRDQYPFVGAADEQKSELLKDILAFANAWRRTTAYILLGVDEVKGGRSLPLGVTQHLNDSDLQQFVNSKTSRPVTFVYRAYSFQGVQIGVVEIPVQARPVYLKKAFGKVAANTVYVRRGSSTDIAQPDEVARMGAADSAATDAKPTFELEWADLSRQAALGASVELRSVVLEPRLSPRALMPPNENSRFSLLIPGIHVPDENYYRDVITYSYDFHCLAPIGFCLRNTSSTAAKSVMIKSRIEKIEGVRLDDNRSEPIKPYLYGLPDIRLPAAQLQNDPDPIVSDFPTHWELTIHFGHVLPKATAWSTGVIYLGSTRTIVLTVPVHLYAENLPDPQVLELGVSIATETRAMTQADLPEDEP